MNANSIQPSKPTGARLLIALSAAAIVIAVVIIAGVLFVGRNTGDRTAISAEMALRSGASPAPTSSAFAVSGAIPPAPLPANEADSAPPQDMFFEDYGVNQFITTADDPLSAFALDVDTGSYTVARSYLTTQDLLPPAEAIRPEEFVNYFAADYPSPTDGAFAVHMEAAPAPFGDDLTLLRVGVQGRYIAPADRIPALLIFVIDVSGSMASDNRLGLVKEALTLLVGELRADDRVGIVVYSDNSRVVLDPTPASDRATILNAITSLQTEGSTNAEAGLVLGYQLAESAARDGEIARVVLCSDGVANVGATGPDAILASIREQAARNITLSAVGFGMGNYNDVLMEQLANDGDGSYYYVDHLREARRVFVHNLTGTLHVIGYDARIQVEFNPQTVASYRLIGYENRAIADDDFRNDSIDAGEVGAGHSVTALYELALVADAPADAPLATAYIRYEDGATRAVAEVQQSLAAGAVLPNIAAAAPSFRVQAGAAEFAELLRGSEYAEGGTFGAVRGLLEPLTSELGDDAQVAELIQLVRLAARFGDQ